jgi:deoxyribodipyrimidine photo-lyase
MKPAPAFEPTREAALARLQAVRPGDYARTRNHLEGAVTGLSPYLTHGLLSLPEVLAHLRRRHRIAWDHKLVFELGWRAYFRHAWQHEGDAIFQSLHEGPLPDAAYASELPADIREARTGLAVIDRAVQTLYATGYLHNHARMWLASYVVHLRKLHWRAGADWMWAHLLDGDLASNHLSWQWVAGTGSHKPYLFNAENVARYAPRDWAVAGSVLDTSYDELFAWAHDAERVAGGGTDGGGLPEPALHAQPPPQAGFSAPHGQDVMAQDVWIVHPWALADPPPGRLVVALCDEAFHRQRPWSERRWRFVTERMASIAALRWFGPGDALVDALKGGGCGRSPLCRCDGCAAAERCGCSVCRAGPALPFVFSLVGASLAGAVFGRAVNFHQRGRRMRIGPTHGAWADNGEPRCVT